MRRGLRPVLAGRNKAAVEALARELNCPSRAFALDSVDAVATQLAGARAVLHCAGPFSATAATMMDACLRAKTHYLDITGEIDVIETGAARDAQAKAAGVAIIPAVGFDVVPSDCLAALLHAQLPTATHLELAFMAGGGLSPGTAKTSLEGLPRGGRARIDGKIASVPTAWKSREIPFADGARWAVTIPWGDVASAYYSTGIPNIEVYMAMPPGQIRQLRRWRWLLPLLTLGPLQRFARRRIERTVKGPSNGGTGSQPLIAVGPRRRSARTLRRGHTANARRLPAHGAHEPDVPRGGTGRQVASRLLDAVASAGRGGDPERSGNGVCRGFVIVVHSHGVWNLWLPTRLP